MHCRKILYLTILSTITSFIEEKAEKYDAPISQGGTNVSGGQKQRLAIARAIVKNPEIYIFDESDYRVEDKTNIILTKNIEQIKDIGHIIVLDKGRIAGEGNHEELLENCLVYQELYKEVNQ